MQALLKKQDAAKILGVSTMTVSRYIQGGKLKAVKLSPRAVRIDSAELESFISGQRIGG
jgi:excisionase family DNA binding protein